jgi:hypothetical protein
MSAPLSTHGSFNIRRIQVVRKGRPARNGPRLELPENRENNREMLKISGYFALSARLRRPFTLQFQRAAGDSLLRIEQAFCPPRTGIFSPR